MTTDTITLPRYVVEALLRESQAVADDHHTPRYVRLDEAIAELTAAIEAAKQERNLADGLKELAEGCKQTKFRRDVKTAVDRFLGWKLPEDFAPDCHITFDAISAIQTPNSWPIGTNLLTADQAKAMFEYCLKGTGYVVHPEAAKQEREAATDAKAQGQDSKALLGHASESSHNRYLRSKETPVAQPVSFRKHATKN